MNNPFEIIEERLSKIESLILSLKNESNQIKEKVQPEQLLTVQEAADFLNLSVPTVYSKVSRGELPVMKRGKKLHFSNTELMQYLRDGRKLTISEIETEAQNYLQKRR